jgi:Protein of unknown function (DUF2958).
MTEKQLLPKYVRDCLPTIDAVSDLAIDELTAQVKFFYPDFSWTWYGIAWDGEDIFFGLVDGVEAEFGNFSLRELLATRGKFGCAIERDRFFTPQPVKPIYESAAGRRALPA